MSLILHLSDLHLGSPSQIQYDFTDKFGLSHPGDSGTDHLERTLAALSTRLSELDSKLDAVIVSGDLTKGNEEDGYAAFEPLLTHLAPVLPARDRILITPGNHDSDWTLQPGRPRKFDKFLKLVRTGYSSSLMLGVDYSTEGHRAPRGGYRTAKPVLALDDAVIVAISSADYCGTREERTKTPWEDVLDAYLKAERKSEDTAIRHAAEQKWRRAEDELRKLRLADIAKVDSEQLSELGRLLDRALPRAPEDDERLRIAVLHHPIGPISEEEEIKPFESLTNLSAVRRFLLTRGFHIVVHGHKHTDYVGWDWLTEPTAEEATAQGRIFVISAPGRFRKDSVVCRLLDTRPGGEEPVAGAPRFSFENVLGVGVGEPVQLTLKAKAISLAQPYFRSENPAVPWIVRARTADAAYQQLRDLRVNGGSRQVISIVESPDSTTTLPSNYPVTRDGTWLTNLVDWWQHPRPEAIRAYMGSKYNHGERLYGGPDLIDVAAKALPSSKSIALLISRQEALDPTREYPALTLVQLQRRSDGAGTLIDVLGIFRKQDLELWWPVNMAELAHIQRKALTAAKKTKLAKPLRPGRLIAMTSSGVKENVLPQIAGTTLDRAIDLEPAYMQKLAYLAVQPQEDTQGKWDDALQDIGTETEGTVLVPSLGIERLCEAVEMVRALGPGSASLTRLANRLQELAERAKAAEADLGDQTGPQPPSEDKVAYWAAELRQDVMRVLAAITSCVRHAAHS
jgi:3',5'-cyclic AMP phosphodiesterase CpdA